MANMRRSRTGDWSVVIDPGPTVHFFYIFSFSSLVRAVANLRRCLHYHINGVYAQWVLIRIVNAFLIDFRHDVYNRSRHL